MPGRVEHDGADFAREYGVARCSLPTMTRLVKTSLPDSTTPQAVIRDVDQHVATGEVIHQVPAPQVCEPAGWRAPAARY